MSQLLDYTLKKAKEDPRLIVLPESSDERVLQAAESILQQGIAKLILLGDKNAIENSPYKLDGAQIIDPKTAPERDEFIDALCEIRKSKGLTREQAAQLLDDDQYFAVMLVKMGMAQGMVSGACHATGDVLRPSLQILKTAPDCKLVSTFFLIEVPDCKYGENGVFVMSDGSLEVNPTPDRLAQVALNAAAATRLMLGFTPCVAMLSHSTLGSANNDDANKVVEATRIAKELAPDLLLDGGLQLDAAIVPEVAALKAPDSPVAGKANVLVFPDLDAANIGYKLLQRLAKALAVGPITQGLAAPVNDLSRGCSAEDIVNSVAITVVQAQDLYK